MPRYLIFPLVFVLSPVIFVGYLLMLQGGVLGAAERSGYSRTATLALEDRTVENQTVSSSWVKRRGWLPPGFRQGRVSTEIDDYDCSNILTVSKGEEVRFLVHPGVVNSGGGISVRSYPVDWDERDRLLSANPGCEYLHALPAMSRDSRYYRRLDYTERPSSTSSRIEFSANLPAGHYFVDVGLSPGVSSDGGNLDFVSYRFAVVVEEI